jgi:Ca-activated chloride channel homolog
VRKRTRALLIVMVFLGLTACSPNPHERNNAGNAALRRGDNVEALAAYQVAQAVNPDAPVPYYNAAIALADAEQLDLARAALDQALETADAALVQKAHYNLGNVYFDMGQYFDAIQAYQRVLLIDPDDEDARYNLELALLFAVAPTPTAQEQQTEPDQGQTDPETTPTDQPGALDGPTPTPPLQDTPPDLTATPEGGTGDFRGDEPSTLVPQERGALTIEEARRLLENIEQNQESLREYLEQIGDSGEPVDIDW